jgi:hypothetical protein
MEISWNTTKDSRTTLPRSASAANQEHKGQGRKFVTKLVMYYSITVTNFLVKKRISFFYN